MNLRTTLANWLRALARRLDGGIEIDVRFSEHPSDVDLAVVPWFALDICAQATRAAARINEIAATNGLTRTDLAELVATTAGFHMTPIDVSDLVMGLRHLRGDAELSAWARALDVDAQLLICPDPELPAVAA